MNRFSGRKGAQKKVTNSNFWFFRELSPKIAQLPPLLLDNSILHKENRKIFAVLSQQFMISCCLQNFQRDDHENDCVDGKVIACLVLTITFVF